MIPQDDESIAEFPSWSFWPPRDVRDNSADEMKLWARLERIEKENEMLKDELKILSADRIELLKRLGDI